MIKHEGTVSGYRFGRFLSFFIFIIFGLAVFLPSSNNMGSDLFQSS
jgi:hypothetical protein